MSTTETVQSCELCGATIYPEHLARNAADRWEGKLLCPHCLGEKRGGGNPADVSLELTAAPTAARPTAARSQVQSLSTVHREPKLNRPLDPVSPAATRCRTFHCKLSDAAMVHINEQINEWVDAHEDVRIKFATSSVGTVEGKHLDPHLIITIFY
jgi:hypothetical protein